MDYGISISDDNHYLICRLHGEVSAQLAETFTRELDEWSRRTRIKHFLTDARDAHNGLEVMQNYQFAYETMPRLGLQRDVRSAILVRSEDHSHDFIEIVSRNAGYNVRIFRDEAEAIEWLEA